MEEFVASSDYHHLDHQSGMGTFKRKRSQRQRPLSPLDTVTTTSSSSHGGGGIDIICDETTTYESTTTTEEEEDLANCLILLAQSGDNNICDGQILENNHHHKSVAAVANVTNGFYGYECRTCNKTFNSFQALGGHRASHKIAKIDYPLLQHDHRHHQWQQHTHNQKQSQNDIRKTKTNTTTNVTLSLLHDGTNLFNKSSSSKIHECSICGSKFSSGQALGGHMRRHRTPTTSQIATGYKKCETDKKQQNVLSLDLNLPAPDDGDDDRNKCMFRVFPPPTLIDCHF